MYSIKLINKADHWVKTVCSIADRELDDDSCPYCADKKVLPGYNDLETMYPELKKEWMTIENELLGLNPRMEIKRSTKEAWWQCSICNYQYTMGIKQRVHKLFRNQNACPYCNGRRQKRRFYI